MLAADRVAPGDDEAVAATLERLAATLDLAIERLAAGDDERGAARAAHDPARPSVSRSAFTLTARVRRLALALRRDGPFGRQGLALAEPEDAAVLESLTRRDRCFPRLLDAAARGGRAAVSEPGRSRARDRGRGARGGCAGDAARAGREPPPIWTGRPGAGLDDVAATTGMVASGADARPAGAPGPAGKSGG